ncbi:MAG: hypothetical protein ABIH66_06830 [bacterium]
MTYFDFRKRQRYNHPQNRKHIEGMISVTVCTAALCENGKKIICTSDRKVYNPELGIAYEPPQRKIISITPRIIMMNAGDLEFQTAIQHRFYDSISGRKKRNLKIRNAANIYIKCLNDESAVMSEQKILAPLNLNFQTFYKEQKKMEPDFVKKIANDLNIFQSPISETIITGFDSEGGHIYCIYNSGIVCRDEVGYASIGGGGKNSDSQLMLSKYTQQADAISALLQVYWAKKRAEANPSVGEYTDMCIVTPTEVQFFTESNIQQIDSLFKMAQENEQKQFEIAKEQLGGTIQKRRSEENK